jgi:mRNA interferase MazF
MESTSPRRGDIWLAALGAARRGEPGKNRPVVVISVDRLLAGIDHELIVAVPLSGSLPPSALRPKVGPEAGIDRPSVALPRGIRGVARPRLLRKLGAIDEEKMGEIERALGLVLGTA